MDQKIIKVGNSLAITIPKSFIDETGFKAGDLLHVHQEPESKSLVVTTTENAKNMNSGVGPDFFMWLNSIEERYSDAIKDLAKI